MIAFAGLFLAGCLEEEAGRPLHYEKGVYGGAPDEPLDEEQVRQLQFRGNAQKF